MIKRHFTKGLETPLTGLEIHRDVWITKEIDGKLITCPDGWSDTAVKICADKYLKPSDNDSIRLLIKRVVCQIANVALLQKYFHDGNNKVDGIDVVSDFRTFKSELTYILTTQRASFNSPVWFNVGIRDKPQTSACFINSVEDSMESILDLIKTEGMIFKGGSGSGVNFSSLRHRNAPLSGGGSSSGPVSFMRAYDSCAGAIKSGGCTRRAAKLVRMDCDHPDFSEFVKCKVMEEEKARALHKAGYSAGIEGDAYATVAFQNSNHSVGLTDSFMEQAKQNESIIRQIAEAAHSCGDPGVQFHDTINKWNTVKESGDIRCSNPCAEFLFLDNSACNLASINLIKYCKDGEFQVDDFVHTVRILVLAMDAMIGRSSYPTPEIERNAKSFRPLGLGFTNLGGLLISIGVPYDSKKGRDIAAGIAGLMTASAYEMSNWLAEKLGPFEEWEKNKGSMGEVLQLHRKAAGQTHQVLSGIAYKKFSDLWHNDSAGYRNAQVTAIAPTGTTSFTMDCASTGIEPVTSLVSRKSLVGGGEIVQECSVLEDGLRAIGIREDTAWQLVEDIKKSGTTQGKRIDPCDVFDCALPDSAGRCISWMGHLEMMEAVQPFISGGISKTVNLPKWTSIDEVRQVFVTAWEMGLKSIAVYRDGSKISQPVEPVHGKLTEDRSGKKELENSGNSNKNDCLAATTFSPRKRLPDTRDSITHKIDIGGHEGYLTAGFYEDGSIGEIFLNMSKEGSTIRGLLDCFAIAVSIGLQHGVPFNVLLEKFAHTRFDPAGFTEGFGFVSSIVDYVFRYLDQHIKHEKAQKEFVGEIAEQLVWKTIPDVTTSTTSSGAGIKMEGPPCRKCGTIMQRAGTCHTCPGCGETDGCG